MHFDDPYVYPGTTVLINKLGITDKAKLERLERALTVNRSQVPISGLVLNEAGWRRIHGHLFEPLYDWAGQYRKMNMAVAGYDELGGARKVVFAPPARIEPEMKEVFSRLRERTNLKHTSHDRFAGEASYLVGRLLQIHPFRDGNGRTIRYFLEQLALQAGHKLNLSVGPAEHVRARWMAASEEIFRPYPNYTPMAQLLSDMVHGRMQANEHRIPIARAIADVQQLRPALIVFVRGQLREAQSGLGRDPGNSELRQRVDDLSKLDQALRKGWPLKELGVLQGIGVTHIALDVAPASMGTERFRALGHAVEGTIRDLPEEQRRSFFERLAPEADKR